MSNAQSSALSVAPWPQVRVPAEVLDLGVPLRHALGTLRHRPVASRSVLSRREAVLLGIFALVLHGAVLHWLSQRPEPVLPQVPVEIPPMTIEFAAPSPPPEPVRPPEPVVEPPPPPPPVVDELAVKPPPKTEPPKPKPQPPKPKPAPKPLPKPVEPAPAPPKAEAPPAPPAPPAPKPVTETPPSANAAYLRNPAPEYPSLAQRRGWEGTVLLRIRVLANGKPGDIQIQTSSGRDVLDQAAVKAVQRWSFVPAKRGDVAQEGWVTVPLDFRLN
ncbi:energy transducer TonB [Pseudomonas sp. PA27(2017)]|uniref:energy transducer TonB n=1 Tax=Pseudomonas sp. PA27(2017) TaxID=1932112 RepID=UPI00095D4F62|nr:energy transducer TonB [Pseudomonas sp. PA27(2017)]OLU32266.1 energy transducer TonB [Pseudomonas sp. PA27(2017)]